MSLKFNKLFILDEKKHEASYKRGVRAYLDIELNDTILVSGFRIMEGKNGLWISFPQVASGKDSKGQSFYNTIFKFKNAQHNSMLTEDIVKAYHAVKAGKSTAGVVEKVY